MTEGGKASQGVNLPTLYSSGGPLIIRPGKSRVLRTPTSFLLPCFNINYTNKAYKDSFLFKPFFFVLEEIDSTC